MRRIHARAHMCSLPETGVLVVLPFALLFARIVTRHQGASRLSCRPRVSLTAAVSMEELILAALE